jgi:hypothetical protein
MGFHNLVDALKQLQDRRDAEAGGAHYFWVDVFTNCQQATVSPPPSNWFERVFRTNVRSIGSLALVLESMDEEDVDKIKALKRVWCLWEVACAVLPSAKHADASAAQLKHNLGQPLHALKDASPAHFQIVLPQRGMREFISSLGDSQKFDRILERIHSVTMEDAEAFHSASPGSPCRRATGRCGLGVCPMDKERILRAVQGSAGGSRGGVSTCSGSGARTTPSAADPGSSGGFAGDVTSGSGSGDGSPFSPLSTPCAPSSPGGASTASSSSSPDDAPGLGLHIVDASVKKALMRWVLEVAEKTIAPTTVEAHLPSLCSLSVVNVGRLYAANNQHILAAALLGRAVEALQGHAQYGAGHNLTLLARLHYGVALSINRKGPEAIEQLKSCLAGWHALRDKLETAAAAVVGLEESGLHGGGPGGHGEEGAEAAQRALAALAPLGEHVTNATAAARCKEVLAIIWEVQDALARAYSHEGSATNLGKALNLQQQCMRSRVESLGRNHKDSLASLNNYGNLVAHNVEKEEVLVAFGSRDAALREAISLFREVYRGREAMLGPHHPDTLASAHNLGTWLLSPGPTQNLSESSSMLELALTGRRKIYTNGDKILLATVRRFAKLRAEQAQLFQREALGLFQEVAESTGEGTNAYTGVTSAILDVARQHILLGERDKALSLTADAIQHYHAKAISLRADANSKDRQLLTKYLDRAARMQKEMGAAARADCATSTEDAAVFDMALLGVCAGALIGAAAVALMVWAKGRAL